ncbi:hypothetical protein F5Y06DRAFT_300915 [Hypoxylon sp. FL0890]|nr:hypothetical protein F5Y06DRAFT_300915 [Hypoxylon sp. FL0890]
MSGSEGDRDLELEKRAELRRLQEENKRLQTYLAIAQFNLAKAENERDIYAQEGWVSRRARQKRERAEAARKRRKDKEGHDSYAAKLLGLKLPTPPGVERKQDALDRKIASYQNRVRRTSAQLLVAAAAGHQWREINLATRQGPLIEGIDPGIPREYRAFDVRRTSSLSSTEAAARVVKHWFDERRRRELRRRNRGTDSDSSDSDDHLTRRISLAMEDDDDSSPDPIVGMARAVMARVNSIPGEGDWADKVMAPIIEKYMGELPRAMLAQVSSKSNGTQPTTSSREPNRPNAPNPETYNPRRWKRRLDLNDLGWLNVNTRQRLENPQDYIPVGWMTWKETEKKYPTLDSLFKMEEKPLNELWDPDRRTLQELKMPFDKRPPLDADIFTMLALERRQGFERREMNPLYQEYSRIPLRLPAKLSDEEMRRGPLEPPPPLPLEAPSGEVIPFSGEEDKSGFPTAKRLARKRSHDDYLDKAELPEVEYHYPIDSPAASTFKFGDGRGVSDIMRPGPLDEPGQIRGSGDAVEYGKVIEREEAPYKRPYTYKGMPAPLPPDFKPRKFGREMNEAERKAYDERWKEERRKTREEVWAALKIPNRESGDKTSKGPGVGEIGEGAQNKVRENNSDGAFWHYEDMSDRDSHVHRIKKVKSLDSTNEKEPVQGVQPPPGESGQPLQPNEPTGAGEGENGGEDQPTANQPAQDQPGQHESERRRSQSRRSQSIKSQQRSPERRRSERRGSEKDSQQGSEHQGSDHGSKQEKPKPKPGSDEDIERNELQNAYDEYKQALIEFLYREEDPSDPSPPDTARLLREAEDRLRAHWAKYGAEGLRSGFFQPKNHAGGAI